MIRSMKKFFDSYISPPREDTEKLSKHSLRLATAALFIEMMRADSAITEEEKKTLTSALRSKFHITTEETSKLIQLAEEEIQKSSSYYEFTSLVKKGFTYEEKGKVIELMWEVAFADARLDKHEEHMVRKIASLIYVSHEDFIATKLKVRDSKKKEKKETHHKKPHS